jgi:hypothetical protein
MYAGRGGNAKRKVLEDGRKRGWVVGKEEGASGQQTSGRRALMVD